MPTATTWSIRPGDARDREPVDRLWESAGMNRVSDLEWKAITGNGAARLLVCEEQGMVIGAAVTAFDGWRAYVYHVAISPDFRSKGVARAVMAEAEENLRRQGAARVYVEVNGENTAGIALCTACGFEPEGDIALVKEIAR